MSEDTEAKVLRGHILESYSYACWRSTLPMTQEICVSKERRCAQRPPFHSRCFEGTVIAAGNRAMIKPSEFTPATSDNARENASRFAVTEPRRRRVFGRAVRCPGETGYGSAVSPGRAV
jgi:hypothetical protein